MNEPTVIDAVIPVGVARTGQKHEKNCLCIHNTGDETKKGSAEVLARYLKNIAATEARSWHYSVDDREIYRHVPDDEVAWHAGDGVSPDGGNLNSIGIEVSFGSNIDPDAAFDNAARLAGHLLHLYGWGAEAVKQHYDFKSKKYPKGKNCPYYFRRDGKWDAFVKRAMEYKESFKKEHWAKAYLDSLTEKGIVESPEAWTDFDAPVTKGALLALVDKALRCK
jgi:N-acetylmuramoyl-L-alanine amidase